MRITDNTILTECASPQQTNITLATLLSTAWWPLLLTLSVNLIDVACLFCVVHDLPHMVWVSRKLNAAKCVDAGPALQVKCCLQMPVYPATLQHIPAPMQESAILTFGKQLKTSLQNVHQQGYGHNDVKAANIFISATGERQPIT